mgnify:CR=1 FL=1
MEATAWPLPEGVRSRLVPGVNGLTMHVLEAGFEPAGRPCVLLLHGFPELSYSWRKVMPALARAGYHVVAPDQRGYGLTTGWNGDYDGDLASFGILNLVRDVLALLHQLGHSSVDAVVGHDFGSPVAAYCALIRPDVFRSVALMSAPFEGPPSFPLGESAEVGNSPGDPAFREALARLTPPRKHYQWYYGTRAANADMRDCPEGIAAFLRAYYHMKSGDWAENAPFPLEAWTAEAFAKLPRYYVMDLDQDMAATVRPHMPSESEVARCTWLSEAELSIYAETFSRTGFQGGLQWYRCALSADQARDLTLFTGRAIEVPACFIAGARDWGIHQRPGGLETMRRHACRRMTACDLIVGAGHWVQQERPDAVVRLLTRFLSRAEG